MRDERSEFRSQSSEKYKKLVQLDVNKTMDHVILSRSEESIAITSI